MLLASGAGMAAAVTPPATAQLAVDAAARNAAYRQADRDLKELQREARLARGAFPGTACVRFEQLVASLGEALGPRSVMFRETLGPLRNRFAQIVNRGCPEGTPGRTFLIDQAGNIRDSGPRRPVPPPPSPTPRTAERAGLAPQQGLTQGDEELIAAQQMLIDLAAANIKEAEAAWARGDCERFRNARNEANDNTAGLDEQYFPPELIEQWRSRVRTLFALSCPPPGAVPPREPVRAAPDPVPPHPDADDLDAIVDDPNASLGPQGLAPDERPPQPLAGASTPGLSPEEEREVARQQNYIDERVEFFLAAAEAATARGDCAARLSALAEAADLIRFNKSRSSVPPDLVESWERRLGELSATPCPPQTGYSAAAPAELSDETRLAIALALGGVEVPGTGIGVTHEPPATETDAALTRGKVRTVGIGGSLGLPLGATRVTVRASYHWGDGRSIFDVAPVTGGFNGAVFGTRSDSGSSGIGAGSVALAGETRVKLSQFRLGAEVDLLAPTPASRVFVTFDYFRDVRRHDLSLIGTVSSVRFDQHRDQRVRDNAFDLGIGGDVPILLGGAMQLDIRAWAAGSYRFGRLRSNERNSSNFGPDSDRDFAIAISDKDQGFGVAVAADARLTYAVSPRLALFAGGGASYRSRVGAVWNPNSGDQILDGLRTGLRTADAWSWRVGAGISIAFGD